VHSATSLCFHTVPSNKHLQFYRPWELTEEQERTIKEQMQDAEDRIEQEMREFRRRKEQRLRELGVSAPSSPDDDMVGEPTPVKASNPRPSDTPSKASQQERDHEENVDDMVQDKEDTVLY